MPRRSLLQAALVEAELLLLLPPPSQKKVVVERLSSSHSSWHAVFIFHPFSLHFWQTVKIFKKNVESYWNQMQYSRKRITCFYCHSFRAFFFQKWELRSICQTVMVMQKNPSFDKSSLFLWTYKSVGPRKPNAVKSNKHVESSSKYDGMECNRGWGS